jgi:predicted  nucleic acid-binding Zn-ribbon protein
MINCFLLVVWCIFDTDSSLIGYGCPDCGMLALAMNS